MQHSQFEYVNTLVKHDMSPLLEGPAGTGKTTLAMEVAKHQKLDFYAMSMTRQTTVNAIIGFTSINGNYISTEFRKAFELGGLFLLDELDAGDPNTLLVFNTIENSYMSFPDGVVDKHPDFRLIATSNPQDQHNLYTGRSKLDEATLDRYERVIINRDSNLEIELSSQESYEEIELARRALEDNSITKPISMRDLIRYHMRKELKLDDEPMHKLLKHDKLIVKNYNDKLSTLRPPPLPPQEDAETVDELFLTIQIEAGATDPQGKTIKIDWETMEQTAWYNKTYTI